ncbi:tRNA pseudouridine(55) synthase TruB [Agromyces humatus]|uniref:tRNA pseudouridine synthase B n=1 Tax=Agromyces humatus TaxID=279573 RepID=A0ABN2K4D7_9MICO|nr:tRNA pseudouridine(55) synthase TruB [Agromyces humatus]
MGVNSGILLVDKPQGITSHDVVARMRRLAGTRKIGHAGTLDPMATGLLVLGVDSATRLLHYLVGLDKEYFATIRLGWGTTTDDAEGEPLPATDVDRAAIAALTDESIHVAMLRQVGEIDQVPSAVSAVKVDGKRAYQRVRDGEQVELASRRVTVSAFELLESRAGDGYVDLDVRVECSSGTYVRALARDLGSALGTAGHLTALRRSRIGQYSVDEASELEGFDVVASLIGPAAAARRSMPVVEVTAAEAVDLGHGKRVAVDEARLAASDRDASFAAIAPGDRLIAIVERRGDQLKVITGFPQQEQS